AAWRDFEDAARKTDTAAMRTALDRVLAVDPAEPTATKRKTTLDTGAAADDDPEMAILMVNHHSGGGRRPEAAREAEKVLRKYKKHWRSHCVVAEHALTVLKDREKAAAALSALPSPDDPECMLDPGGLLYAISLSDVLGRDAAPLRGMIVRRLLPALRGGTAANAPPGAKAQLVNCYLQPFTDPAALTDLAAYWAAAAKLADAAVTEAVEKGDADVLVQLGLVGERTLRALALLRDHEKMPPERFEALAKEIDDRTRRAWAAAKEKAPTRPEPYHGLAILAVRGKDVAGAVESLRQGILACGERPELLELLTPLLTEFGDPLVAMGLAWKAAENAGNDPARWCLAANAASAARRRDIAIAACQNARRPPNEKHPLACQIEARLWLEAGEPAKALDLLRSFEPNVLRVHPQLAHLHARALSESGLTVLLDDEFAAVVAAHDAGGTLRPPVPVVAFLRGVFEAKNAAAHVPWVAKRANEVAAKWPDAVPARRLVADSLYRTAELTDPPWNVEASRAALRAFDALPLAGKEDFNAVAHMALLQLRGLKDAGAAFRTTAPLREPDAAPLLTPGQMEVLGAVYTAHGKPSEAVALLERATATTAASAGCWIQLALAYHANRQPADARAAIERVLTFTNRSPREQAEWQAAKLLLQRENP
ncbi:MAG TPA: hypothetical protein VMZ71_09080, partial [Gemmataceae bacterium]|nr:hypothetical protein [Gemmataceae bacterium]